MTQASTTIITQQPTNTIENAIMINDDRCLFITMWSYVFKSSIAYIISSKICLVYAAAAAVFESGVSYELTLQV